jgi:hypothetical protein
MASKQFRDGQTDIYSTLTSYDASISVTTAELAIVAALVIGDVSSNILSGEYTSPNGSTWLVNQLDPSNIDNTVIYNYPLGTISRDCIITTVHEPLSEMNSYTVNISSLADASNSNSNSEKFYMEPTSSSLYDSNYVISTSFIQYCYDSDILLNGIPANAHIQATFDTTNANTNIQQALHSSYNTRVGPYPNGLSDVGPDPLSMSEDVSFNTLSAYGGGLNTAVSGDYQSYWATSNTSNGEVTFTKIDDSYQLTNNSYDVTIIPDVSLNQLSLDHDVGVFKIVQNNARIDVGIITNNVENTITYLNKLPFFDISAGITSTTTLTTNTIPGPMNEDTFFTLFNDDVKNTVSDLWDFNIDVSSVFNSGYNLDTSCALVTSFDNSDIYDNPYYMSNFVNESHTLDFSTPNDMPISITDSSYGSSSTIESITIDLSLGEKLPMVYAGQNGEIKIIANTPISRTTLLSSDPSNSITTEVWYSGDTGILSRDPIESEEMTHSVFQTFIQKIAQTTTDPSATDVCVTNNDAMLTLYGSDEVVNNKFNPADFSLDFSNGLFTNDSVRLWRINALNQLVADPASLHDSSDNVINNIFTGGYMTNLATDSSNIFNNSQYQVALTKKVITDLGLYTDVSNALGWSISLLNNNPNGLEVNSTNAYSIENHLPEYNPDLLLQLKAGSDLSYSYEYVIQNNNTTRSGGVKESIKVIYSDSSNSQITFIIPDSDITRTDVSRNISYDDYSTNLYTLRPPYDMSQWKLVYVTNTTTYDATFNPRYSSYSNILVTLTGITLTTNYYALINQAGKYAPASALKFVNITDLTASALTASTLTAISERINTTSSPVLAGILKYADLCPFTSTVQGFQTDTWNNVSEPIDTDVFYGLDNNYELINIDTSNTDVDVVITIEYTGYTEGGSSEASNTSLSETQYYIPLENNSNNTYYSVTSFESTPSNLLTTTSLSSATLGSNKDYLTVQDNYRNTILSSWSSSQYTVSVANIGTANNITTTLTVKSVVDDKTIFSIIQKEGTHFLGRFIVSYIPLDIYRSEKFLEKHTTLVDTTIFSQTFVSTNYSVSSGLDTVNNIVGFSNIKGFYLRNNVGDTFDSLTVGLGNSVKYNVLADYVTVAPIGHAADPSSNNQLIDSSMLTYQDSSDNHYSAKFTLSKYRGYSSTGQSSVNNLQVYTINRDSTTVTFKVGADVSQTLTSNMYVGQTLTVDNLVDADGPCADLNISCTTNYSISPTGSDMSYNITLVADPVTVTISNTNYNGDASNIDVPSGSTSVVNPKSYTDSMTLLDYGPDDVYTFSGTFKGVAPVSIRPSRIKLRNIAYAFNSLTYFIKYNFRVCDISKAISQINNEMDTTYNWLGNPTLLTDVSTNWYLQQSLDNTEIKAGITIGKYFIKLRNDVSTVQNTCYFVSCPPYYKFKCVSSANAPVIPYNYDSVSSNNLITRYLPYTGSTTTFNPFAPTVSMLDINQNDLSYTNDETIINNIIFNLVNSYSPTLINMLKNPDSTIYKIIVPGIIVNIVLHKGLYPNESIIEHEIYNGPITSIPTTANISNTSIIFRNRDASGGIHFSMCQFPSDVGYPSGLNTYRYLYKTSTQSIYYTINLCMENPSWYNYSPVYFNANAIGTKPILYTSQVVYNTSINKNCYRIFKYGSNTAVDFNDSESTKQSLTLSFNNNREYFDVPFSEYTFSDISTLTFESIINSMNVANLSVTWTADDSYNSPTYVGWVFGNSNISNKIQIELFNTNPNQKKLIFIKLLEFTILRNAFGVILSKTNHDGYIEAPSASSPYIHPDTTTGIYGFGGYKRV